MDANDNNLTLNVLYIKFQPTEFNRRRLFHVYGMTKPSTKFELISCLTSSVLVLIAIILDSLKTESSIEMDSLLLNETADEILIADNAMGTKISLMQSSAAPLCLERLKPRTKDKSRLSLR